MSQGGNQAVTKVVTQTKYLYFKLDMDMENQAAGF